MGASRRRHGRLIAGAIATIALLALAPPAFAAPGNASDPTYATDGTVQAIARSGNTIYLGGDFTRVGPPTGPFASIDAASGIVDASLPAVSGSAAGVYAVAPDGSGGYYIGGDFTHVGGVPRADAAHILANDTVDPNWAPNPNGAVFALAVGDGNVYIGGLFSGADSIGGTATRNFVAAVDPLTGAVRSGWNPNPNGYVGAISIAGSIVYLGGGFNGANAINGLTRNYAAAVDATTGVDTGWNPNLDGDVLAILAEPVLGGAIVYLGGNFTHVGGVGRNFAGAVDGTSGTNLLSWNPDTDGAVEAIAFGAGEVYIGGLFTHVSASSRQYVAEVSALTGAPTAWTAGLVGSSGSVSALALSGDGSTLYVGGDFTDANTTVARSNLAALYTTAGTPMGITPGTATAWNPTANGTVDALTVRGTHVLAGGGFSLVGGVPRNDAAAINAADGKVTAWDPEPNSFVDAIAASGGTVYLGGTFTTLAGGADPRSYVAAVDATSGGPTSWNPGPTGPVDSIALSGGDVYIGGLFNMVGGQSRDSVAAIAASSGAPTSWAPLVSGEVEAIAISGNTVYLGGMINEVGATPRKNAAAIDTSGNLLQWDPEADNEVFALAVGSGVVYVGGQFNAIGAGGNQVSRPNLAAVDPATGIATAWDPQPDGGVRALAISSGTVYAGGYFEHVAGQARRSVVGLDPSTGAPTAWNPMPHFGHVIALIAAADGTIYVGGSFPGFDLSAQPSFASFGELPVNQGAPSITGTAASGKQLTCSPGTWSGSTPQSYSYQWLRDGSAIGGASSAAYTVGGPDLGHRLVCRVTASNLTGSAVASSVPLAVPLPAPRLGRLSISPGSIVAARRGGSIARARRTGATVRYTDTAASQTTFTVRRARSGKCGKRHHRHRCTLYKRVGSFARPDTAGKNSFHFTGRVGGRALKPGRYRLEATPRASGEPGNTQTVGFSVKR